MPRATTQLILAGTIVLAYFLVLPSCIPARTDSKRPVTPLDSTTYNMHRGIDVKSHEVKPVYIFPDKDIYKDGDTVATYSNGILKGAYNKDVKYGVILGNYVKQVKLINSLVLE